MDEQLKNLKEKMNKTVYQQVVFSEQQKKVILERIHHQEPLLAILQLLQTAKTGYEIKQALLRRGVNSFLENEGKLYLFLHELEMEQSIISEWKDNEKYYTLAAKGRKILHSFEQKQRTPILKSIPEGGM